MGDESTLWKEGHTPNKGVVYRRLMGTLFGAQGGLTSQMLVPGAGGKAIVDLDHGDAVGHGAYDLTQVTAHTLGLIDHGDARVIFGGVDALVRAILTGHHALVAANAGLGVDLGDRFVVQIQIAPTGDAGDRASH